MRNIFSTRQRTLICHALLFLSTSQKKCCQKCYKNPTSTSLYKEKIYRTMEKILNRRINSRPTQNKKLELFLDDAWFTLSINVNVKKSQ